jgi:hypothetical protein
MQYFCKELNQTFHSKDDLFKAIRENKDAIIATKRMQIKQADSIVTMPIDEVATKSTNSSNDVNYLSAKLVINTTNLMDSHSDVHLKGIWNKSVKEAKNVLLLQEHKMTFDHIISDNVKAAVQLMKWSDLGYKFDGDTEALVFDTTMTKERNPFMFTQYAKGYVKEHSVGMRYVKLDLALNSESKWDVEEKEVWDKYISQIVNKEQAEAQGYFWAVHEAKIIEGSAVVKGSNYATPVISIEPSADTQPKDAAARSQSHDSTTSTKTKSLSINKFL